MRRILRREYIVFVVIAVLAISGFSLHLPPAKTSNGSQSFRPLRRNPGDSAPSISVQQDSNPTVYLTSNITVGSGQVLSIVDENVVAESLSLTSLTINSTGTVLIENSSIYLSGASYSTVRQLFIRMQNGSTLEVYNSTLVFQGGIFLNGSHSTISGSYLNSSGYKGSNPYSDTLEFQADNSTINILNSTMWGLYRQNTSYEYGDAGLYCTVPLFSKQNTTVPMSPFYTLKDASVINQVAFNVTYVGNITGDNNSLWVYYNSTMLGKFVLPYTYGTAYEYRNFTVNLSGVDHNLTWMEDSSNFRIVAHFNYYDAIAIENLTETMMSNDTVSLYGNGIYSYGFANSTAVILNSSLGVNNGKIAEANGEPNPSRLFLSAVNSEILSGDTQIQQSGVYSNPYFELKNSTLFYFRLIAASLYSHGIPVSNGTFSLNDDSVGNLTINGTEISAFDSIINATGNGWLLQSRTHTALYEAYGGSSISRYDGQFRMVSGNSAMILSVPPFPYLARGILSVEFNVTVPYATFNVSAAVLNSSGTGQVVVNYAGNLSSPGSGNYSLTISGINGTIYSAGGELSGLQTAGELVDNLTVGEAVSPGNYTVIFHAWSKYPSAFARDGYANGTLYVRKSAVITRDYVSAITERGLPAGTVWGIALNGHTYFTENATLLLTLEGNATGKVITPENTRSSEKTLNISRDASNFTINFTSIEYSLTFVNSGVISQGNWKVIVGGTIYNSYGTSMTVTLPPGVYNYEIVDPSGYSLNKSMGIVNLTRSGVTVIVNSTHQKELEDTIVNYVSLPQHYLPISAVIFAVASLMVWRSSHRWYMCERCGSTRKRKRDTCTYCGK